MKSHGRHVLEYHGRHRDDDCKFHCPVQRDDGAVQCLDCGKVWLVAKS